MATIDEVLSILASSKSILELPTASNPLSTEWAIIWNNTTNRAEKVRLSSIIKEFTWIWIELSFVEKDTGNTDELVLEVNDIVWFKKITNAGDPLTLVGFTYIGGDKQLLSSYEQQQAIAT
jgi:hypothetical protein